MTLLGFVLIIIGIVFSLIGGVGAIRLPDFYSRAQAVGVLDTVGTFSILLGVACLHGFSIVSLKLIFLLIFIYIANPTVTHVFARAANKSGLKPVNRKPS